MLLQSLTLTALTTTSIALSLPAIALSETSPAIQLVASSPAPPQWACDVRAWVRAPDLSPNLLSTADARLIVNGTDCVNLVRWEVGLRLKERSIVRVPAENVEVPVEPERNYTAEHGHFVGRGEKGIFEAGQRFRSRRPDTSSPYFTEMEKYEEAMKNHSLWKVEGRERIVFDSRLELASATGDNALPLAAVKSFAIAVPNINLPPTPKSSNMWSSGDSTPEFASVESQLTYYFALTLRNGTTLELPAGNTVFNTVEAHSKESNSPESISVLVQPPSGPHWGRKSACTLDNTTHFEIQIDLPSTGASFRPGTQVFLNTTITRIGNVSTIPTYISLLPETQLEQTWAATFGRTFQQKLTLSRAEGTSWRFDRGLRRKTIKSVKSRAEEEAENDGSPIIGPIIAWDELERFGQRAVGGTELKNSSVQSVLVNLTIHADAMPSFAATFKTYLSFLQVEVQTIQDCPEDYVMDSISIGEDDDLRNDSLWSTTTLLEQARRAGHSSLRRENEITQRGNATIHIEALPSSFNTPPTHYRTPNTPAPILLAALPADGMPPTFATMMGEELREETTDAELKPKRYGTWSISRIRWGDRADGGFQHAGQVWARKLRREQDAMEARVLHEGFQIQE